MKVLFFFNLVLLGVSSVSAQQNSTTLPIEKVEVSSESTGTGVVSQLHTKLSTNLIDFSRYLDSLLGTDSREDELAGSRVKVEFTSNSLEGAEPVFKTRIKTRLQLPKTQRRFHLVFHNIRDQIREDLFEPEKERSTEVFSSPEDSVRDSDFSAALRYVFRESKNFHIHTDAGVKLKSPLDPFTRLRMRQTADMGRWNLNVQEELEWFDSRGVGYGAGLQFVRPLSRSWWFKQVNWAGWQEENNFHELQNGISLVQVLPRDRLLSYDLGVRGDDKFAIAAQSYSVGVSFRTWMFWSWFKATVNPYFSWSRERNFVGAPGIIVGFEVSAGQL